CKNVIRRAWRNHRKRKMKLLAKRLAYWAFLHVELKCKPGVGVDYFSCMGEFQKLNKEIGRTPR
ncbi:hypothetical protein KAT92_04990, partial [Candidatus Babeliales bacterium]|nr:hypothetical protein [Candidatus Babeliales bacterium]